MPSELEIRLQGGDKEGITKDFDRLAKVLDEAHLSTVDMLKNMRFLRQVQQYILEEVKG